MLKIITKITAEIGKKLLEWRETGGINGEWVGTQFKAEADIRAHEVLTEKLEMAVPGIPIISEEDSKSWTNNRPDEYWIIDPIDGTASYANGFPGFVTQVALIQNGKPVFAAIYAPVLNEMYTAEINKKSYLNGQVLLISSKKQCLTLIDNYPQPRGITLEAYQQLGFSKYLECGSISLKICKLASGSADLFFKDITVRDWDIGAPQLVIETAGGFISKLNGDQFEYKGDFSHEGLVASCVKKDALRLMSWYKNSVKEKKEEFINKK
jgi:3'(2'), 5'-bisphosphate nucleotidase